MASGIGQGRFRNPKSQRVRSFGQGRFLNPYRPHQRGRNFAPVRFQNQNPQLNQRRSVETNSWHFPSPNVQSNQAISVGGGETIPKTSNANASWNSQTSSAINGPGRFSAPTYNSRSSVGSTGLDKFLHQNSFGGQQTRFLNPNYQSNQPVMPRGASGQERLRCTNPNSVVRHPARLGSCVRDRFPNSNLAPFANGRERLPNPNATNKQYTAVASFSGERLPNPNATNKQYAAVASFGGERLPNPNATNKQYAAVASFGGERLPNPNATNKQYTAVASFGGERLPNPNATNKQYTAVASFGGERLPNPNATNKQYTAVASFGGERLPNPNATNTQYTAVASFGGERLPNPNPTSKQYTAGVNIGGERLPNPSPTNKQYASVANIGGERLPNPNSAIHQHALILHNSFNGKRFPNPNTTSNQSTSFASFVLRRSPTPTSNETTGFSGFGGALYPSNRVNQPRPLATGERFPTPNSLAPRSTAHENNFSATQSSQMVLYTSFDSRLARVSYGEDNERKLEEYTLYLTLRRDHIKKNGTAIERRDELETIENYLDIINQPDLADPSLTKSCITACQELARQNPIPEAFKSHSIFQPTIEANHTGSSENSYEPPSTTAATISCVTETDISKSNTSRPISTNAKDSTVPHISMPKASTPTTSIPYNSNTLTKTIQVTTTTAAAGKNNGFPTTFTPKIKPKPLAATIIDGGNTSDTANSTVIPVASKPKTPLSTITAALRSIAAMNVLPNTANTSKSNALTNTTTAFKVSTATTSPASSKSSTAKAISTTNSNGFSAKSTSQTYNPVYSIDYIIPTKSKGFAAESMSKRLTDITAAAAPIPKRSNDIRAAAASISNGSSDNTVAAPLISKASSHTIAATPKTATDTITASIDKTAIDTTAAPISKTAKDTMASGIPKATSKQTNPMNSGAEPKALTEITTPISNETGTGSLNSKALTEITTYGSKSKSFDSVTSSTSNTKTSTDTRTPSSKSKPSTETTITVVSLKPKTPTSTTNPVTKSKESIDATTFVSKSKPSTNADQITETLPTTTPKAVKAKSSSNKSTGRKHKDKTVNTETALVPFTSTRQLRQRPHRKNCEQGADDEDSSPPIPPVNQPSPIKRRGRKPKENKAPAATASKLCNEKKKRRRVIEPNDSEHEEPEHEELDLHKPLPKRAKTSTTDSTTARLNEKTIPTKKGKNAAMKMIEQAIRKEPYFPIRTVIGPVDIVVNSGLGKIKIESDYIPLPTIKAEAASPTRNEERPETDLVQNPESRVPSLASDYSDGIITRCTTANAQIVNFGELIIKDEPMDNGYESNEFIVPMDITTAEGRQELSESGPELRFELLRDPNIPYDYNYALTLSQPLNK